MVMDPIFLRPRSTGPRFDDDAQLFFTNVGITDGAQKAAINELVVELKDIGVWDTQIAVYPTAGGTAAKHKFNLKDPRDADDAYRLTFSGGIVHSATGMLANGTNGYANTHVNPNEDLPPYSAHISIYNRTNTAPDGSDYFLWGAGGMGLDDYNFARMYAPTSQSDINNVGQIIVNSGQTNFNRLRTYSVYGPDYFKIFRDAVELGSNTTVRYGYWPHLDPNVIQPIWLFGQNVNNSLAWPSAKEFSYVSIGTGHDDALVAAHSTAVANYQTAMGRAV